MIDDTMIGTFAGEVKEERNDSIAGYETSIIEAKVFTCMPGTAPVKVPKREPAIHAAITNNTSSGPTSEEICSSDLKNGTTVSLRFRHSYRSVLDRYIEHPFDIHAEMVSQFGYLGAFIEHNKSILHDDPVFFHGTDKC